MISIRDEDKQRIARIKELTSLPGWMTSERRAEVYRLSSQVLVNITALMQEKAYPAPMIAGQS
jgi:hypothetical protein